MAETLSGAGPENDIKRDVLLGRSTATGRTATTAARTMPKPPTRGERPQPLTPAQACCDPHRTVVVSIVGDLDLATRESWYDACVTAVGPHVHVDLGATTFMDCCGYSALTAARHVVEARGATLTWHSAHGEASRLLQLIATARPTGAAPLAGGQSADR